MIAPHYLQGYVLAVIFSGLASPAFAQTPTIFNSSTAYHYAGCYTETNNLPSTSGARALNGGAVQVGTGNMTVNTCLEFCGGGSGATYKYAGLEYSRQVVQYWIVMSEA